MSTPSGSQHHPGQKNTHAVHHLRQHTSHTRLRRPAPPQPCGKYRLLPGEHRHRDPSGPLLHRYSRGRGLRAHPARDLDHGVRGDRRPVAQHRRHPVPLLVLPTTILTCRSEWRGLPHGTTRISPILVPLWVTEMDINLYR